MSNSSDVSSCNRSGPQPCGIGFRSRTPRVSQPPLSGALSGSPRVSDASGSPSNGFTGRAGAFNGFAAAAPVTFSGVFCLHRRVASNSCEPFFVCNGYHVCSGRLREQRVAASWYKERAVHRRALLRDMCSEPTRTDRHRSTTSLKQSHQPSGRQVV